MQCLKYMMQRLHGSVDLLNQETDDCELLWDTRLSSLLTKSRGEGKAPCVTQVLASAEVLLAPADCQSGADTF